MSYGLFWECVVLLSVTPNNKDQDKLHWPGVTPVGRVQVYQGLIYQILLDVVFSCKDTLEFMDWGSLNTYGHC